MLKFNSVGSVCRKQKGPYGSTIVVRWTWPFTRKGNLPYRMDAIDDKGNILETRYDDHPDEVITRYFAEEYSKDVGWHISDVVALSFSMVNLLRGYMADRAYADGRYLIYLPESFLEGMKLWHTRNCENMPGECSVLAITNYEGPVDELVILQSLSQKGRYFVVDIRNQYVLTPKEL